MICRTLAYFRDRVNEKSLSNPQKAQKHILRKILKLLKDCAIGQNLGLENITNIGQFQKNVPVTNYNFYRNYIRDIFEEKESVMFPGKPVCVAQTGGTTSAPKQFPLGKHLIKSYRQFNLDMVFRYMRDSGNYDILKGKIFLVAASPSGSFTRQGIPIGRASGIMAQIAPNLLQRRYVPGMDVIRNPNTEHKIQQTSQSAYLQRHNIRIAAGLTPYLMAAWNNLVNYAFEKEGYRRKLKDILPNLKVVFHGGTTFNLYMDIMQELTGNKVDHWNVYSAAEGPIAFQFTRDIPGLALAQDSVFFEFLPQNQKNYPTPQTFLLDEVKSGVPYYILLTTQGGLLRYKIGDLVEFIHTTPPLLRVIGRAEDQIDLSGEKMNVNQALIALQETSRALGINVLDFMVCPTKLREESNKQIAHEWIIESQNPPQSVNKFRHELEHNLYSCNTRYKQLREHNFAIGLPEITFVPPGTFQHYIETEFVYGQQKILHMHNDRSSVERLLHYAEKDRINSTC